MSRSSMSIFFSWLSVMLCTNIALNTGDLKRRIIFSASNLIICSQSLSCPTWHRGWLCDRTARPPHIWWSRHWRFPSPTGNWNPMKVSRNKSCHWTWVSSEHKDWMKCPAHSSLALLNSPPWPPGRTAAHPSRRWWSRTGPSACPRGWSGCSEGRAAANWANKL